MKGLISNKKKGIVIVLNIIAIFVISMLLIFRQENFTAKAQKINTNGDSDKLSFDLLVTPEVVKVKSGETVEISMDLSQINVGENGLNSIVGNLKYDEKLFDSMTFIGSENVSNDGNTKDTTKWNVELNQIKDSDLYGKFCIYTMKEGVKDNQNVAKISLKLKDNLKPQTTKIVFENLESSDGKIEVPDENRVVTIIIYDDEKTPEIPEDEKPIPEEPQTPQSPQTGDTNIIIAVIILILTVLMDIVFFGLNKNKSHNIGKKFLGLLLVLLIGGSCIYNFTNAEEQLKDAIDILDVKQTWLNSSKYLVTDDNVSRIAPNTKIKDMTEELSKDVEISSNDSNSVENNNSNNGSNINNNNNVNENDIVTSGMKIGIKNGTNEDADKDKTYNISVLGDINGDGKSNQIELTSVIRNNVDSEKWKLEDIEKLSGDLNCDNDINKQDVDLSVRYIVYGEMTIPEIEDVEKPDVEVVSGNYSDKLKAYISNEVEIKITENAENAQNTKYKIETVSEESGEIKEIVQYTEISREQLNSEGKFETIIKISDNGVYKISAYTTGKLGNRSKIPYIIVHKTVGTFGYQIHYFYDGIENESKKISGTGNLGSPISITPKKEDGNYILDTHYGEGDYIGTQGIPIIISENEEKNVGYVYYVTKGKEYHISGEVIGGNGVISDISETVFEGQNSTKDIIVTPNKGYKIKEIKKYTSSEYSDIEDIKKYGNVENIYNVSRSMNIEKFENVRGNIHVTVEFEPSPYVAQIVKIPSDIDQNIKGEDGEIILNQQYTTLNDAIIDAKIANDASSDKNKLVEIIILKDIENETNIVKDNNNISIDLKGYNINYSGTSEINYTLQTENAKLTIIDTSTTGTGKISNKNGVGVYIKKTGELTVGVNDDDVSLITPVVQGSTYGVYKEFDVNDEKVVNDKDGKEYYPEGIFNFYDGIIIGGKKDDGYNALNMQKIDNTPDNYNATIMTNSETGNQEATLHVVSDVEATIGKRRYSRIEDAISDANKLVGTPDEQVEITVMKDITKDESHKIFVDSSKNIKLDLNGHTLTTSANENVIVNSGKLEIYDSSEKIDEETGEKIAGTGKIKGSTRDSIINCVYGEKIIKKIGLDEINIVSGTIEQYEGNTVINYPKDMNFKFSVEQETDVNLEITGVELNNLSTCIYVDGKDVTYSYRQKKVNYGSGWGLAHVNLGKVTAGEHTVRITYSSGHYNTPKFESFTITSGEGRGNLTLTSGTYETSDIKNYADMYINGGTVNVGVNSYISGYIEINDGDINGCIDSDSGTKTLIKGGNFNSLTYCVKNAGNLIIENEPVFNSVHNQVNRYYALSNTGKMQINGGTYIGGIGNSENNYNDVIITKAQISSPDDAISNSGNIIIENVTINSANYILKNTTGETVIKNITLKMDDQNNPVISNGIKNGTGTVRLNSGKIYVKNNVIENETGTIEINGGEFTSSSNGIIITNGGNFIMNDGKITSNGSCIKNSSTHGSIPTLNINGGIMKSINSTPIIEDNIYGKTVCIIGKKDNVINNNSPIIQGKDTAISLICKGTIKFYDGVLVGTKHNVISGIIDDVSGELVKEDKDDGLEYISLGISKNIVARISVNDNPNVSGIEQKYYKLENGYYNFYTLNSAITACLDNKNTTIQLMEDEVYIGGTVNIPVSKDITIDFNGKTIYGFANINIENNGKLKFTNTCEDDNIEYGKLICNKGTLIKNNSSAIFNMEKIQTSGSVIVLDNYGTSNIKNSKIDGNGTINNKDFGILNIEDSETGVVENFAASENNSDINVFTYKNSTCLKGITNSGTGTVLSLNSTMNYNDNASTGTLIVENSISKNGISNVGTGKVIIKGDDNKSGTITNRDKDGIIEIQGGKIGGKNYSIENYGKMVITGGKFDEQYELTTSLNRLNTICNYDTGNIEISGDDTYIYAKNKDTIKNMGTIIINGGTIKSDKSIGISNVNGTVTIGTNDGIVNYNMVINGKTSGIKNTGTLNFYDGIIEGEEGKSIVGTITNSEAGYSQIKHIGEYDFDNGTTEKYHVDSGREILVLESVDIAYVESTGKKYTSITDALNETADTDTIKLLNNYMYTETQQSFEIGENKNIILDLNGYNIISSKTGTIINNGNLTIKGTRNSEDGEIVTSNFTAENTDIIQNNGTLVIESGSYGITSGGTSRLSFNFIKNTGNLVVNDGVFSSSTYGKSICNTTGNVTINGGTFNNIENSGSGTINILGGKINGSRESVLNSSTDGVININNAFVSSQIVNKKSGTINILGGNIANETTSYNPITNSGSGTINITGGTIKGYGSIISKYKIKAIISNEGIGTINIDGTGLTGDDKIELSDDYGFWDEYLYNIYNVQKEGIINVKGKVNINCKSSYGWERAAIYAQAGTVNIGDKNNMTNDVIITSTEMGIKENIGTVLNYYGGKISAPLAVCGGIEAISSGYQLITDYDGNNEVLTIGNESDVVQVGSNKYSSLQDAVNKNDGGTLVLLKGFRITTSDVVEIPENKEFVLDLNGKTITTYLNGEWILNKGNLTLTDSSSAHNGNITGIMNTIIKNEGTLELAGGNINSNNDVGNLRNFRIIYNTGNGNIKVSGGNYKSKIRTSNPNYPTNINWKGRDYGDIIWSDSPSKIVITGGALETVTEYSGTNHDCIFTANENSSLEMTGGSITNNAIDSKGIRMSLGGNIDLSGDSKIMSNGYSISVGYSGVINISDPVVVTGTISGSCDAYITGGTIGTIKTKNATVTGGTIGKADQGDVINISDNAKIGTGEEVAIRKYAKVNITGGVISGGILDDESDLISMNLTMSGGKVVGTSYGIKFKNAGTVVNITDGEISASNGPGIWEIKGKLILGVNDKEIPSIISPVVKGTTCGVKNEKGEFEFYDGIIKSDLSSNSSIDGDVSKRPEMYVVSNESDENNKFAVLRINGDIEKVAEVNNIEYTNFYDAINEAIKLNTTVKIFKGIELTDVITIPNGSNVTIDLAGHTLQGSISSGALIINNGTLTIIDSSESSTTDFATIENTAGAAIENNGTLIIGVDDNVNNNNSPRIIGVSEAVIGSGTKKLFDGQIINK